VKNMTALSQNTIDKLTGQNNLSQSGNVIVNGEGIKLVWQFSTSHAYQRM